MQGCNYRFGQTPVSCTKQVNFSSQQNPVVSRVQLNAGCDVYKTTTNAAQRCAKTFCTDMVEQLICGRVSLIMEHPQSPSIRALQKEGRRLQGDVLLIMRSLAQDFLNYLALVVT